MEARHVLPALILSIRYGSILSLGGLMLIGSVSTANAQFPRLARQPLANLAPTPGRGSIPVLNAHSNHRTPPSHAFRAESEHFIVMADDPQLANRVAEEAERFRKELALEWLGVPLGTWQDKCPIEVELGMHAGGETSFAFVTDETGRGRPISWQMKIFGPPDRLIDAVLPHEITHTIFATHFGRPLPRWADEGACTTVEHESERNKNHRMLMDFLTAQPSRGIPFNRMFTMKNYPHDILPLYAQGYSLARFLIAQKGRRYFLDYIAAGMQAESSTAELQAWDVTTEKFYGYSDLSDLQIAWLGWVRGGSTDLPEGRIASAPTLTETLPRSENASAIAAAPTTDNAPATLAANFDAAVEDWGNVDEETTSEDEARGGWYVRQSQNGSARVAANRESLSPPKVNESTIQNDVRFSDERPKAVRDDARLNLNPETQTLWR